jgi:hypothetical protein
MSGDAKVVMIVNVTAVEEHLQESLSSLSFAKKVNATRVNANDTQDNIEWTEQ